MTEKKVFKSDAFEAIHSSASALHKIGAIDKTTMRGFDVSCLALPADIKPEQIKLIRELNHVSQPIFARYLNTGRESPVKRLCAGRSTDATNSVFATPAGRRAPRSAAPLDRNVVRMMLRDVGLVSSLAKYLDSTESALSNGRIAPS